MSPESALFLKKGAALLHQAETMLSVGLHDAVGRTAYLAAYHVAQAFIFERNGRAAKTHNGVQTEFLRLTRNDPRIDCRL